MTMLRSKQTCPDGQVFNPYSADFRDNCNQLCPGNKYATDFFSFLCFFFDDLTYPYSDQCCPYYNSCYNGAASVQVKTV